MAIKSSSANHTGTWFQASNPSNNGTETGTAWIDNLLVSTSVNPRGNNPFEVEHITRDGSFVRGFDGIYVHQGNYPSALYMYGFGAFFDTSTPTGTGRKLLALTNPSRPKVLLPTFISELRDLPEMVRQAGRAAIHVRNGVSKGDLLGQLRRAKAPTEAIASANLAYQFGWKPFVQDLWTMANFQDAVDDRRKVLKKLREKGLRRTIKNLGSWSKIEVWKGALTSRDFQSRQVVITHNKVISGGCIWKETFNGAADLSDGNIRAHIMGYSPDNIALNVWEALPWSWFTDYFNNIGDMLQAGNRSIATPSRAWTKSVSTTVMTHPTYTSTRAPHVTYGKHIVTAGNHVRKRIARYPALGDSPNETAQIPILGSGQLSILGSLTVVKNRRILRGSPR